MDAQNEATNSRKQNAEQSAQGPVITQSESSENTSLVLKLTEELRRKEEALANIHKLIDSKDALI